MINFYKCQNFTENDTKQDAQEKREMGMENSKQSQAAGDKAEDTTAKTSTKKTAKTSTKTTAKTNTKTTAKTDRDIVVQDKSRRKLLLLAVTGAALVLLAAIIACVTVFGDSDRKLQEQLDLGAKYLEAMDYERALTAFNTALSIEPQNADAYLGIAEVYMKTNENESALEYAREGYEVTGDERLKEKVDMMESAGEEKTDKSKAVSSEMQTGTGQEYEIVDDHMAGNVTEGNVTEENVVDYVYEGVPELKDYASYISANSSGQASLTIYLEGEEDRAVDNDGVEHFCYAIYVGESWPDHNVNWDRFYVDRESMQIYWYDFLEGIIYDLEDWRKSIWYRQL